MKGYELLLRCFYMVLALVFLMISIVTVKQFSLGSFLIGFICISALIVAGLFFVYQYRDWIERRGRQLEVAILIFFGTIVLINGFYLRFTPSFDFAAVYEGAVSWVTNGSFEPFYEYYYYFPNNLGAMALLALIFKLISFFGVTDFFAVGILINSICIIGTMFFSSAVVSELFGKTARFVSYLFYLLFLPFYFMGAAFYTDSLSMMMPVLFYYLYLLFCKDNRTKKQRIGLLTGMSIVIAVGSFIKFTVVIMIIAVCMDCLFRRKGKDAVKILVGSILMIVLFSGLLNTIIYSGHLDLKTAEKQNTPILHWVMMGLKGNGGYNGEDYIFSRSLEKENQNDVLLGEIRKRINDRGIDGMAELIMQKSLTCFGDGTLSLSDFLDDKPVHNTWLHRYILYEGKQYQTYRQGSTTVLMIVYLCLISGCLISCFKKIKLELLAPRLAVFGIWLFLMCWEASGRYITNFIPMILLSGVIGIMEMKGVCRNVV